MKIDNELVDKLAKLSKLKFDNNEKEGLKKDLEEILNLIDRLQEVDTENVDPLIYLTPNTNVLREDKVENMVSKTVGLKNAPNKDSDYFKVPKVLNK